LVLEKNAPDITLVYLPHLDYDYQRYPEHDPARVAEVDRCAARVINAASKQGIQSIVVSEYGLVPVSKAVHINRILRERGWLVVRDGPFGEMLMPGASRAFAVADHQLAHVYVNDSTIMNDVRNALKTPQASPMSLNPRRSDWIILAAASGSPWQNRMPGSRITTGTMTRERPTLQRASTSIVSPATTPANCS
jgi:predicted AlkP superfamily pyrophosphatase or phosphodiesterase